MLAKINMSDLDLQKKQLGFGLKFKPNGKSLYPTNSVKCLGGKINDEIHIDEISAKLRKANTSLSKMRYFVDKKTLKAIYHAIF